MSLVVGADLEFTAARRRDGKSVAAESQVIRTPLTSIDHLLELFGTSPEGDSEAALVRAMTERLAEEPAAYFGDQAFRLRFWCQHAGVSYELAKADDADGEFRVVERLEVVRRYPRDSHGLLRTFTVELDPETSWEHSRIVFNESYERAGEPLGYGHNVATTRIEIAALFDGRMPQPDEVAAAYRKLVEQGEFEPRGARDRVAAWLEEAGVKCSRSGVNRVVPLPVDGLQVTIGSDRSVDFRASSDAEPGMFYLETERDSVAPLVECLSRRVPVGDGLLDDRLIAAFVGLANGGQLDGRPMTVRDRLASWYDEAGVPYTCRAFGRRRDVGLVSVHRDRTNCIFTLTVSLDPDGEHEGIGLGEKYDYLATRNDAGREYAYTTYAPYSSLERLVGYFEKDDVREGELEERLIACFADLVARGELGEQLPIEANHERAAAWFAAAGVPAKKSTWSWINSD
ncbi:hypothetical protein OG394_01085 [Kribbella sp. NBC_01245]|uniref:hypothetical protein n=1 Tax=Kribbella sp. NBC_01245 TaxID=2903578 RepID=UPI002E2B5905|nr:hypothetical protein [Kribbella sp. NBC_01245]